MNTKGIKFLAVLAVLAMAFAAFAVLTTVEQEDDADPTVVNENVADLEALAAALETATENPGKDYNLTMTADISLTSGVTIGGNVNLIVSTGKTLTISSGQKMTVVGKITNNGTINNIAGDKGAYQPTATSLGLLVSGEDAIITSDSTGLIKGTMSPQVVLTQGTVEKQVIDRADNVGGASDYQEALYIYNVALNTEANVLNVEFKGITAVKGSHAMRIDTNAGDVLLDKIKFSPSTGSSLVIDSPVNIQGSSNTGTITVSDITLNKTKLAAGHAIIGINTASQKVASIESEVDGVTIYVDDTVSSIRAVQAFTIVDDLTLPDSLLFRNAVNVIVAAEKTLIADVDFCEKDGAAVLLGNGASFMGEVKSGESIANLSFTAGENANITAGSVELGGVITQADIDAAGGDIVLLNGAKLQGDIVISGDVAVKLDDAATVTIEGDLFLEGELLVDAGKTLAVAEGASLAVDEGATLDVSAAAAFNVEGTVTGEITGGMTLTGSVLISEDTTFSGNITVSNGCNLMIAPDVTVRIDGDLVLTGTAKVYNAGTLLVDGADDFNAAKAATNYFNTTSAKLFINSAKYTGKTAGATICATVNVSGKGDVTLNAGSPISTTVKSKISDLTYAFCGTDSLKIDLANAAFAFYTEPVVLGDGVALEPMIKTATSYTYDLEGVKAVEVTVNYLLPVTLTITDDAEPAVAIPEEDVAVYANINGDGETFIAIHDGEDGVYSVPAGRALKLKIVDEAFDYQYDDIIFTKNEEILIDGILDNETVVLDKLQIVTFNMNSVGGATANAGTVLVSINDEDAIEYDISELEFTAYKGDKVVITVGIPTGYAIDDIVMAGATSIVGVVVTLDEAGDGPYNLVVTYKVPVANVEYTVEVAGYDGAAASGIKATVGSETTTKGDGEKFTFAEGTFVTFAPVAIEGYTAVITIDAAPIANPVIIGADNKDIVITYTEGAKLTIANTAGSDVSFTVNGEEYTGEMYVGDGVEVQIFKSGYTVTGFSYTLAGDAEQVLGDVVTITPAMMGGVDKAMTITAVTGSIGSYNIAVIPIEKATITTSQALATKNTVITVYVTVNDSKYTIGDDSVIVVDSELELIPVTPVKDEDEKILYYTFVMPGDDVTVTGELLQTSYSVSVSSSITNGKVTASPTSIKASDLAGGATKTVTLTIEPKTGYELGTLKVKNAEGEYIEYVLDKNKATFVVSEENASDFTVTATFQEVAKAIYTGLQQYIVKFDGEAVPIDIVVFNDQMKPVSGWSISSSDSTVVKVVQDPATKEYTVTAEKAGTAKLTVKYGSLTTTAVVKVYTAIGELKSGISVDQTLNGAWMIADGIESFKVEKGATLTIAKDASLDLNGKVLRVDGKLVISQGANVYGGTIDFAVDASIDNKGFVGMDVPVSIIIHSYTEDGIYVAQTGNITVCDVNGVEMSAEEDDDVDEIYYMVISGDIEGFTVFSNVTGTFISDDLSLSAVELWNSSIKVSEDTTLNIGDDAYANDVYMMLEEGAKAVVDGKTKDVVVMAYTGTQLVSAVDPVYTPTALVLDNVKGVEVVSYKEKYAVYNEWTEENVYWYKMVMDVSGEVSMVDVSKKAVTFKVMAINDGTLVGATVTDNLVLPKDIQFAKLSDYTPSAGSRAEVIIPLLEDSMLYVEGLVKLAGDEAFVALTNVEGTEYISEKVVYVSNFEDAVDAISTVTDKKIFVYGDVTLESDLAADCVIEMLDGVLTIGDDATVKVAAKADIVPKAGTQIEVEGIIILLDGNNSLILPTELHGYNVKTENPDGSIEYSSLAAAIASGKKDITIEGVAFLDEKTSVDSGSKITVPKDADLIILNNFNLAEGATITVEKGGDLFIGTLEKLVEFNVNGTITIEKGAKILLHDAKVTVSGTIIVENGAEIVADDSVEVNAAAVIVPVEKKDTTFITNIDNAVTIANTYAKDPVEIEVYGKINGGNVKLADNVSITFMDDVKSKVSIELSKTSTVTINAGAEVSGTIAAPYGAEDGLKTLKATVSGASNVKFVVTSEESDKVYYTAEIKVITPANKVQGEITVTEGEAKITTNMKVANTTEEPSKLTINANATVYLAKNVELDAGKGTTVKGALVVEKDAVLKAKDLSASGTVYVEKDGTIEITKMTVTGSLVIEEDAAKAVIKGALTVGSKSKSLGDAASVIGDITLEEGTIKVYAGGDVSGAYINWDDINEKSDSVNTVFTINDKIYMTVYANKDAVLIGKILADESFEITGVDNAALKVAANWSGSKNAVAYDAAAGTGTKIGATDYTTVGTKAIPSEVTLKVSEGTGLKVFIDGFGYLTYDGKIAVGTHTVKFDVESGYDGSKATIAVNGKTVKSGESFTVTADDLQIVIVASGATPVEPTPSPEPQPQPIIIEEDDSFGITQILLIVLVILIGVLVVVLILRFNRS